MYVLARKFKILTIKKISPNGGFGDFMWLFWRFLVLILLILLAPCTFWRENSKYWPGFIYFSRTMEFFSAKQSVDCIDRFRILQYRGSHSSHKRPSPTFDCYHNYSSSRRPWTNDPWLLVYHQSYLLFTAVNSLHKLQGLFCCYLETRHAKLKLHIQSKWLIFRFLLSKRIDFWFSYSRNIDVF